ncbi:MAG TPA: amidohydrolase family protein [Actinophytocola sp.]|nr:amidohydrolase family protein [Actinophytocola sp.]
MNSFDHSRLDEDELLLEPEWVLLPDGPARRHAVLVRHGVFAEVGPSEAVESRHPDLTPLRMDETLLMPGLVDTHHHLTQSFGKALVFGEPSEIFRRVWVPLEAGLDEESAYLASKLAALESLRGGFTTVCDAGTRMEPDVGVVAEAASDAGIRCVLGMICNDLRPDGGHEPHDAVLARAQAHLERWDRHDLIHPSLAVSIPEAATTPTLAAVSDLCRSRGAVFQTHVNEHLAAVERSLERHGRRPLEALFDDGILGAQCLLAHVTLLTPTEITMLRDSGSAVSYNPVASSWKGNAVAPALTFAAQGIRFGIGSDGTRGDGFRLMDAAETAQRLAYGAQTGDSSTGGGWTWLDHATSGGAAAAGLGGVTGSVTEGLAADYLLVDLAVPEMLPSWDMEWELVRLANRDQILAVVIGGRPRLWRGWPVDWDARQLMEDARRRAQKVVANAPVHIVHPTAGEHRRVHRAHRPTRAPE